VADTTNYSRHYRQRLRAEVLLDAVSDVTGRPVQLCRHAGGSRAMQFVDAPRRFDVLGHVWPSGSESRSTLRANQGIDRDAGRCILMNAAELQRKLSSDEGRAARLADSELTVDAIVEELYLTAYARCPDATERAVAGRVFAAAQSRRRAVEDLLGR